MNPVVPFGAELNTGKENLVFPVPVPAYVATASFGSCFQHTMEWLCIAHALLDVAEEEKACRKTFLRDERKEWGLICDVRREHLNIIESELLEASRRRDLAAAAIRKFYGKALEGEALFRDMLQKQRLISQEKHKDIDTLSEREELLSAMKSKNNNSEEHKR